MTLYKSFFIKEMQEYRLRAISVLTFLMQSLSPWTVFNMFCMEETFKSQKKREDVTTFIWRFDRNK